MQSKINGFFVAFQSKGEKQTLTPHHQRIRQTALKDCIVIVDAVYANLRAVSKAILKCTKYQSGMLR